jgi:archaellum component FlaC
MTPQAVAVYSENRGAGMNEGNNESRIGRIEDRLVEVDSRLDGLENRLVKVEDRLDRVEDRLVKVEGRLDRIDDRLARVESDILEVKGQVRDLHYEFNIFKIDVAKEFGAVRGEFGKVLTSIERTKVWMITTGVSTVLAVAGIISVKVH